MKTETEPKPLPVFVIDPNPVVSWPVTVRLPVDGGTFDEFQFSARLRVLSERAYSELWAADKAAEDVALADYMENSAKLLTQVVADWSGPVDAENVAVAFSPDVLRQQLIGPYGQALAKGLWKAVAEVRYGAVLGNSAPLLASGLSDAAATVAATS